MGRTVLINPALDDLNALEGIRGVKVGALIALCTDEEAGRRIAILSFEYTTHRNARCIGLV